jgi:hypothetical protein
MAAQLGFFTEREPSIRNMKYDGRFAFARIRYETGPGGYYYAACRPGPTGMRRAGAANGRKRAS